MNLFGRVDVTFKGAANLTIKDKNGREVEVELLKDVTFDTDIFSDGLYHAQIDIDVDSRDIRNVSLVWTSEEAEKDSKLNIYMITLDPIYRDVYNRGSYFKFFCHHQWEPVKVNELTQFSPCWIDDVLKEIDYETEHNPQ